MKKILIALVVVLILVIIGYFILPRFISPKDKVHYHAGFQVYVDDKLQDFSDWKYMHEKPCSVDGKPIDSHEDEQIEKAHLHDQTGDVVHVHREGAKWKDLFTNIKYPINDKNLVVYVDGKKVEDFLNKSIEPYESVVIFIGSHKDDEKYLKNAVKRDYIEKIEKKSETCGAGN